MMCLSHMTSPELGKVGGLNHMISDMPGSNGHPGGRSGTSVACY